MSANAISLGLIATELVINALTYAFPNAKTAATVLLVYEVNGTDRKLAWDALRTADRPQRAGWAPVWFSPWRTNWMRKSKSSEARTA